MILRLLRSRSLGPLTPLLGWLLVAAAAVPNVRAQSVRMEGTVRDSSAASIPAAAFRSGKITWPGGHEEPVQFQFLFALQSSFSGP